MFVAELYQTNSGVFTTLYIPCYILIAIEKAKKKIMKFSCYS